MQQVSMAMCISIALSVLVGCANSSSGVFETGKDTYTVVETGNYIHTPVGDLKKKAYQKADEFCHSQGKVMQPVSTNTRPGQPYVMPAFELVFQALDPSDPEYRRPTLEAVPDVKIEVDKSSSE